MTRSVLLLGVAALAFSCGRSALFEEPQPDEPGWAANEQPLYVFRGDGCPSAGTERDLEPARYERLAVVRFRAVEECSGEGGEWLIGRQIDSSRDYFVGGHACFFLPEDLRKPGSTWFGLVRFSQTAGLFRTPEGWCVTNADGRQPVTTDSRSLAWGVYRTEQLARAALARLESKR